MLGTRGRYRVILATAVVAIAVPCCADTVTSVAFSGNLFFDGAGPSFNGPGTYTFGTGPNYVSATLLYQDGEATLSGSGSNTTNFTQSADPTITVSFEVSGSISEPVPVIFTGSGSTSQSGAWSSVNGGITWPVGEPFGDLAFSACSEGSSIVGGCDNGEASSFSSTLHANVTPGTIYQFVLGFTGGSSNAASGDTWSMSIDPEVEIDPSFADASDFTLEFSANPPAPEASSLQLMLAGCLALGAAAWLRSARTRRIDRSDRI